MKNQIDLLTSLAVHARDYVKSKGIEPLDKYIVFANDLVAYCQEDYSFFSLAFDSHTKVHIHTYNGGKDNGSITFDTNATAEDLQAIYERAFKSIFEYEQNNVEVLEKQRLAQITELESKLAKLRDL
jgi:sulfatase maturation enzyme AslB (radical SAM superfamily)